MPRLELPASGVAALMLLLAGCAAEAPPPTPRFPSDAESMLDGFRRTGEPSAGAYDSLFRYFLLGWETYRLPDGAGAAYPGLSSKHGAHADHIEGFARVAPMVAAWIFSGRPGAVDLPGGGRADLPALLRRGVLHGTDPESPGYWGAIADRDQRIVEASDIALALWLTRATLWETLTPPERSRVGRWLLQVNGKQVSDNNWHIFVAFTNVVLHALGQPADLGEARRHYLRLKSFYRGDGWFSDGPSAVFDYYNAWGIHYQLYWLARVDPSWDPDFIRDVSARFLGNYRYLFGPAGFPIRGRSVCYRMATPAPLVAGYAASPHAVPADEARHALDQVWRYFIARGAVRDGTVTQGYCGPDARVLDSYSGPASCLWSLRSLVMAFSREPSAALWTAAGGRSPVDTADVDVRIPAIGWRIVGRKGSGFVSIVNDDSLGASKTALRSPDFVHRVAERVLGRPFRPANTKAKYHRGVYRGDRPFCGCPGGEGGRAGLESSRAQPPMFGLLFRSAEGSGKQTWVP
jgi:hypothetical protein